MGPPGMAGRAPPRPRAPKPNIQKAKTMQPIPENKLEESLGMEFDDSPATKPPQQVVEEKKERSSSSLADAILNDDYAKKPAPMR